MVFGKKSAEQRRSQQIDKQLIQDYKNQNEFHSILLLGAGESGKTTILKQMRLIHINGYTDDEKLKKVIDIRNNIHESIYNIVYNLKKLRPPIEVRRKEVRNAAAYILNLGGGPLTEYTSEYYDMVKLLWNDEDIQAMFRRANEYQLLDSTEEFMNRLDVIRDSNYVPTTQDILYCRVKTTSITKITFQVPVPKMKGGGIAKFVMFDVGGQRGHRIKWISVFEGIQNILFVISVSDFDQTLREDGSTNRLEESLTLFDNMFNSRYLQSECAIIFLNKEDILAKKIKRTSIGTYFAKYKTFKKSRDELINTKLFIHNEVTTIIESGNNNKRTFIHFTVATNTEIIQNIFNSVHEVITEKALKNILPF